MALSCGCYVVLSTFCFHVLSFFLFIFLFLFLFLFFFTLPRDLTHLDLLWTPPLFYFFALTDEKRKTDIQPHSTAPSAPLRACRSSIPEESWRCLPLDTSPRLRISPPIIERLFLIPLKNREYPLKSFIIVIYLFLFF